MNWLIVGLEIIFLPCKLLDVLYGTLVLANTGSILLFMFINLSQGVYWFLNFYPFYDIFLNDRFKFKELNISFYKFFIIIFITIYFKLNIRLNILLGLFIIKLLLYFTSNLIINNTFIKNLIYFLSRVLFLVILNSKIRLNQILILNTYFLLYLIYNETKIIKYRKIN